MMHPPTESEDRRADAEEALRVEIEGQIDALLRGDIDGYFGVELCDVTDDQGIVDGLVRTLAAVASKDQAARIVIDRLRAQLIARVDFDKVRRAGDDS